MSKGRPYTWPLFFEKKRKQKKMMCDSSANDFRTVKWRNRRNFFFLSNGKSSEWFHPRRQLFDAFFSNFFNLILISHSQSVFQTFFSLRQPYTLPKKLTKIYGPCEHTSIHQLWFLMSPPANLLVFLFFYKVAQFLPIYCSNVYKYDLLRRW